MRTETFKSVLPLTLLLALLVAVALSISFTGSTSACSMIPPYYEVVASVTYVYDGDTIQVWIENTVVDLDPAGEVYENTYDVVRFGGGIDAPEDPEEEGGPEATEFIENIIPSGTTVYLDLDNLAEDPDGRPYRGVYSRLIAVIYVEIDGQWVNINAELLRWGMEAYPGNDWDQYTHIPSEFDMYEWPPYDNYYPYVLGFEPLDVSISPDENNCMAGENVTFTVTVRHFCENVDNYSMTVENTWPAVLSENRLENVHPGEIRAVMLTVTVPENAKHRMEDNITVILTSVENAEISDSDSCIVRAITFDVSLSVSPAWQENFLGGGLDYAVIVVNSGLVMDNYILTVLDNLGWCLSLSGNLLENIEPGENKLVTLSITIPENAIGCTEDNITITATSMTDNRISDNDSCIVHAISQKAEFSLITLYRLSLDVDIWLNEGSRLVIKFYTYVGDNQGEKIIRDNLTSPTRVTFLENVACPDNEPIENATLASMDNKGNVISTIKSFTVIKGTLFRRYLEIKGEYPKPGADRTALFSEFLDVKKQYPWVPT